MLTKIRTYRHIHCDMWVTRSHGRALVPLYHTLETSKKTTHHRGWPNVNKNSDRPKKETCIVRKFPNQHIRPSSTTTLIEKVIETHNEAEVRTQCNNGSLSLCFTLECSMSAAVACSTKRSCLKYAYEYVVGKVDNRCM